MTFLSTYTRSGLFKDLVNSKYLGVLTRERYEGSIREEMMMMMMMVLDQVVEINERKKDLLSRVVGSIVEEGDVWLSDKVS